MSTHSNAATLILRRRIGQLALALVGAIALSAPIARASSVTVVYTGTNDINGAGQIMADVGDQLSFDIMLDFRDASTIGGSFDLLFDPSTLSLNLNNGFQLNLALCDGTDCFGFGGPTINDDRIWFSWGTFNGFQDLARMATVTLTVTSLASSGSFVATGPNTDPIGSGFISGDDFVTVLDVEYNQIGIAPVPLPAAIWSMMLGLSALLGLTRSTRPAG